MPEIPIPSVKKAVLVGVHSKPEKFLGKVPGAHRDVKKLRQFLVNTYQYDFNNIKVLIDSEKIPESDRAKCWPTRENILQAMRELVKDRQAGDHIVFSFSGHGEQTDPDKDQNEEDGQDEILIPADYEVTDSSTDAKTIKYSHFIRDDEIREIFVDGLAEGVRCTLIFDCCHSGTAGDLNEEDDAEDDDEAKGSQPGAPGFTKKETVHHRHAARSNEGDLNMAAALTNEKQVTSWSACSDAQITYGGVKGGYFVDAFVGILQNAKRNGKTITYRELLLGLRAKFRTIIEDANSQMQASGKPNQVALNTPEPQLGSLIPECILNRRFTL